MLELFHEGIRVKARIRTFVPNRLKRISAFECGPRIHGNYGDAAGKSSANGNYMLYPGDLQRRSRITGDELSAKVRTARHHCLEHSRKLYIESINRAAIDNGICVAALHRFANKAKILNVLEPRLGWNRHFGSCVCQLA